MKLNMKKKRMAEKNPLQNGVLKNLFIAWLSLLFVLLNQSKISANINSGNSHFNLKLENVTFIELFTSINKKSEFTFVYNVDDIKKLGTISCEFQESTIVQILDHCLENTNMSYIIRDSVVILSPKEKLKNEIPAKSQQIDGTGSIRGKIIDEEGLPMVGATIILNQTTTGAITDINGDYQLLGVPEGKQTIKVSFIGYTEEVREIDVLPNKVVNVNIQMKLSAAEISGIEVYGQARGQLAAINEQLNAKGIINVVSSERMQELPDVNIAEAVGRLPGLMVQRDRGEGQKIVIRGLQPKYNSISINGNIAPSTSTEDRSTDLNMISPEILGGVEVLKANTADKDANGLGGTVNLIIREAPSGKKVTSNVLVGYSGLSKSLGNYKANIYASNRFFKEKLGVMITGNLESAERNSDAFNVNYDVTGTPKYKEGETYIKPWITSETLQANIENRIRSGGSFMLDWQLSPSSTIKSSNFIGYLKRNIYDRGKSYDVTSNYLYLDQTQEVVTQMLFSNSIEGKHIILGSVLDWGISRSQSMNERPYSHDISFRKLDAFRGYAMGKSFDVGPPELLPSPENVKDTLDQYFFQNGNFRPYEAQEIEKGVQLNWKIPFKLGEHFSGNIKIGTKYRSKDRYRNNIRYNSSMFGTGDVNNFLQQYPDYILTTKGNVGKISLLNFLDSGYKPRRFLNGDYEYLQIDQVLDRNLMAQLYDDYLGNYYDSIPSAAKDDYITNENIFAYYLMTELKIGKYITFIPGIRYEKTNIKYESYIAEDFPASESIPVNVFFQDTIGRNTYHHFLPQIHLQIKPTDWFDIRLAYTNTLSRPDYNQLAPKKIINVNSRNIELGNTELKPALSRNYDLILTFYKQKYGLLTLGAFYKDIQDFLWNKQALVIADSKTDPDILGIPQSSLGFTVHYPVNNLNRSSIKGFEVDIQSNMDFLPIKGFVFNLNLTLMESKTKYPEVLVQRTANPDFGVIPGAPRVIFTNKDTAYVDRLLSQPTYLANAGLGYDNKKIGLSARLSFNFQDDILTKEQRRPDGADREGTLAFYRWDFQMNQRITKRLSFTANVSNIFNQPDRSSRLLTGYITKIEYYGYMVQAGIRFNLF